MDCATPVPDENCKKIGKKKINRFGRLNFPANYDKFLLGLGTGPRAFSVLTPLIFLFFFLIGLGSYSRFFSDKFISPISHMGSQQGRSLRLLLRKVNGEEADTRRYLCGPAISAIMSFMHTSYIDHSSSVFRRRTQKRMLKSWGHVLRSNTLLCFCNKYIFKKVNILS